MEQSINIADLVRPKFSAGQDVWSIARDYSSRVQYINSIRITKIGYTVEIVNEKGVERRQAVLRYFDHGGQTYFEHQLVGSLNDLPEADRKPRAG